MSFLTVEELAYIREFVEVDGISKVAIALGKSKATVNAARSRLKREELWDVYKGVWWQVGDRLEVC